MKKTMMTLRPCLLFLCLGWFLLSYSQELELSNLKTTQDGEVSFEFTISQSHSKREIYDVEVFTSADNFARPLNLTQKAIVPGIVKNVSFNAVHHLPNGFKGALRIKLVAEATVFPVQISNYTRKAKPGGAISIDWIDPIDRGSYTVVMDQNGSQTELAEDLNSESFSGFLPSDIKKGGYELRVIPVNERQSASDEMAFTVAPKIGMGMKVLGLVAVGGVGILATASGGEPGGSSGTLPGPPDTPDN